MKESVAKINKTTTRAKNFVYFYCDIFGLELEEFPHSEPDEAQMTDILRIMDDIKPRDAQALRLRYGLDSGQMMTFETVGHEMHVNRERVRQLTLRGLRYLRHPHRVRALKRVFDPSAVDCYDLDNYVEPPIGGGRNLEEGIEMPFLAACPGSEINPDQWMDIPISELDPSVRAYNVLLRARIETIGQLLRYTEDEVARLRNMGRKATDEIIGKLALRGLHLAEEHIPEPLPTTREGLNLAPIEQLNLSVRATNVLARANIKTVGQLLRYTEDEIARLRNMGRRATEEIIETLAKHGLQLSEGQAPFEYDDKPLAEITLEDLNLSVRTYNVLKRAGINRLLDLTEYTETQLMRVRNNCRKSVSEVEDTLARFSLHLKSDFDA